MIAVREIILFIALAINLGLVASNPACGSSQSDPCFSEEKSEANNKKEETCSNEECTIIAPKILNSMDTNIDPCDDFYQFTCGGFSKSANIPDGKTSIHTLEIIEDQLSQQLRKIMEEPSKPEEPKCFNLVKNFYKSCMDTAKIEREGVNPLLEILRNLGGWPVLEGDSWNEKIFDWKDSVYKLRETGYSSNYFTTVKVAGDPKNTTKRFIHIDQPWLELSSRHLRKGIDDEFVKVYYSYMVDVAMILGADKTKAETELKESLDFEMQLANISLPYEKRQDGDEIVMTLEQLSEKYKSIPWKKYINKLLPSEIQLGDDELVIINAPSFLESFEKLLENTPNRTLANYAMWRAVSESLGYLNEEVRNKQLKYSIAVGRYPEQEPRWKECVELANIKLSISVGAMYVRRNLPKDAKDDALEMFANIKREYIKILEKVDWMDDTTKKSALEKAASLTGRIAYPDELLNDKMIEEFYEKLNFPGDSYLGTILNLNVFSTNYDFKKLKESGTKSDWIRYGAAANVGSFYHSKENDYSVGAGLFQGNLFHKDRPRYLNYGAIGFIMGTEMTVNIERKYENIVKEWAPETKEKYLKRAECLIHHYGNYTPGKTNLKLNQIGNHAANNGGIKEAYFAYLEWVKRNGPEPRLPGLKFSPNQLFWISAASIWCGKIQPESLNNETTDVLDSVKTRALGLFSNIPEFAEDFNCPVNSRMNPKDKCSIW